MKAKPDIRRQFVEKAVDSAIKDIRIDPDRSIRRYIEYARELSRGRFSKYFFSLADRMLEGGTSEYYSLARRLVYDVSPEALKCFGMNVGYNSCVYGAEMIRKNEKKLSADIPWTIAFIISENGCAMPDEEIKRIIREASALGVYSYIFYCKDTAVHTGLLRSVCGGFPSCAFTAFLSPETITATEASELSCLYNLMISFSLDSPAFKNCCSLLKQHHALFSAYKLYNDTTVGDILSGKWLSDASSAGSAFAVAIAGKDVSVLNTALVIEYIRRIRDGQKHPILLMELCSDIKAIDQVISDAPSSVAFYPDGTPGFMNGAEKSFKGSIFGVSFSSFLSESIHKKQPTAHIK